MSDNHLPPTPRRILDLYRNHPDTTGHVRTADRSLATKLCNDRVPIDTVEDALTLVAARRALNPDLRALPIRSLHYFLPAIQELLHRPLDPGYVDYLRDFLNRNPQDRSID